MPENNADKNAAIAAQQASQDAAGKSMAPVEMADTSSALDKLKSESDARAKQKAEAEAEAVPPVEPKTETLPAKPAAEPKAGAPEPKPAATPPAVVAPPAVPPKDEAAVKRADDLFKDAPSLPPGASPKSSEAFAAVKIRAAQEVSKLEQKIQELTKTTSELSEKLKTPVPSEITKELTELREFRARLDVDLDPKFKEFDKAVSSAQEFIYTQLRKSPVITDDVIAQIKKHGGPENVNLTKIFEAVKDPTIQRLVESKVADIEHQKFNKDQAIKDTKENIGKYLSEREKSFKQSVESHTSTTKKELDKLVAGLAWLKETAPEAGADEAATKSAKEHNEFVSLTRKQLDEALSDDSPEMRAIMLVGMAQLFNLQRVHAGTRAEVDSLKTQLSEATALVDRLKSSSRTPLTSGAPTAATPANKPKDDFSTPAGDALDRIRDQVVEARSKAQSGA